VLEYLDKKLDGGEDLCIGLEVVAVGSAISNGVSASFVHEELLQGEGRANASRRAAPCCRPGDVLGERLASLGRVGSQVYGAIDGEAAVLPFDHALGQPR
jgi:hypothetical protein